MAVGDITKALAAKVRTSLDEASAGFWTDTEIYNALADGQREIVNIISTIYKTKSALNGSEKLPEVLRAIMATTTSQTGTQNLPADYWTWLVIYTGTTPVYVRPDGLDKTLKFNTYMASSAAQPYCSITSTQVVFETSVTWFMDYLKTMTDMSGSVDPVVPSMAYNVLVEYAIAFLLNKDENPRAQNHFNNFITLVQQLYI